MVNNSSFHDVTHEVTPMQVFSRLHVCFNLYLLPDICLKPKQVKCLEALLLGKDVISILPTGYGKSFIFQILADFLPQKHSRNIVLIISPLTSIIDDQLKVLAERNICAAVLPFSFMSTTTDLFSSGDADKKGEEKSNNSLLRNISDDIKKGNMKLLYGHPEAFFSEEGRLLLKSKVFQENVVACAVDEAHCVEMWGQEFRPEFMNISVLKALFRNIPIIALTATATQKRIANLKKDLCLTNNCVVIKTNPNRKNIFLNKIVRSSNQNVIKGYEEILTPIVEKLHIQRVNFPMTIIYFKTLQFCGWAYNYFSNFFGNDQYVDDEKTPVSRLFAQYHLPQTQLMKKEIVNEIKKQNSRIRVIFATIALGMGVDASNIRQVIHIGAQGSLESYMQEIGRAGRSGEPSTATLYYNKSDISANKTNIDDSLRRYCNEETCLRKNLQEHFGYNNISQKRCCCFCDGVQLDENELLVNFENIGIVPNESLRSSFISEVNQCLDSWVIDSFMENFMDTTSNIDKNIASVLFDNIFDIKKEEDLLTKYNIWDEDISSKIFAIINKYSM